MPHFNAIILAAGKSTRMRSDLPKVLHPVAGKQMIRHTIDTVRQAGSDLVLAVVGHRADLVRDILGDSVLYAIQEQQLGTGHAVQQARSLLSVIDVPVLVLAGDVPLITADTVSKLVRQHLEKGAVVTLLTGKTESTEGLGRIVRGRDGQVQRIVEERDATERDRAIDEVNSGIYCFDPEWLWPHLEMVKPSASGELYLTDVIGMATEEGSQVEAVVALDSNEILGINNRVQLAKAEDILRKRITERWMLEGVTIVHPSSVFIDSEVEIGKDSVIYPNTFLQGTTRIGENSAIGPNSIVRNSRIGNNCRVLSSVIEESVLEDEIDIGPFSHVRPESHIGTHVHIGNFAEIKKSKLGPHTQMGHFSYLGDAIVGASVNIAAGTVTCNFDGERKHQTIIGDDVFIGSDTMLVAPVELGDRAVTGAGSVVTTNVPPDTVVYGVPARPRKKRDSAIQEE